MSSTFARASRNDAKVAQLVEHNLAKVRVAGSSPVFRSFVPKGSCVVVEYSTTSSFCIN